MKRTTLMGLYGSRLIDKEFIYTFPPLITNKTLVTLETSERKEGRSEDLLVFLLFEGF